MRSRGLLAMAAVAVLGASCTGGPEPDRRPPPTPRAFEGFLIGPIEGTQGRALGILDLSTGESLKVEGLPPDPFIPSAVWGSDGHAYLLAFARLFRVAPDGRATRIGPLLPSYVRVLAEADGAVFAVTCGREQRGVWALRLGRPDAWQRLGDGCPAAVSPDGGAVAAAVRSADRIEVVRLAADGSGEPELLLDLGDLEDLRTVAGIARPRVVGMAWGQAGIALAVSEAPGGSTPFAVVVLPTGGEPVVLAMGSSPVRTLAWQPGGTLLAIEQCANCYFHYDPHADLRMYDAATGELRQVAVSAQPFVGVSWSPEGDALVGRWRPGELLFVAPDGTVLARRDSEVSPWDWGR